MGWQFDPSTWQDNVTIPHAADFQNIAKDIHRWGANVDGATYELVNLSGVLVNPAGRMGIGIASPAYPIDLSGDVNITGSYRVNGVSITAGGGIQTPWLSNINAAGYNLLNTGNIGVFNPSPVFAVDVVGDVNVTGTFRVNGVPFNPTAGVTKFNGRTGNVVPVTGDYSVGMILGALSDPTTTLGDMLVRSATVVSRLPVGADGQVLTADHTQTLGVKWAPYAAGVSSWNTRTGAVVPQAGDYSVGQVTGAVATTTQVLAGAGLGGGGALSANVTLTANVVSVFGRTGAVVLTSADISGASGVLTTRNVNTGLGLTGGGPLSADLTIAGVVMGASGASHAAGLVPDAGATAGATRYLREDATWAIPAGAGGGLTDPTTTLGDLLVRGSSAVTRLGVGANNYVLTADSTQTLGVKWAVAPAGLWSSGSGGAIYYNGGSVGIGTASPDSRLTVSLNAAALQAAPAASVAHLANVDGTQTELLVDGYGAAGIIELRSAGGTAAAPTASAANSLLGALIGTGRGATSYGQSPSIYFWASQAWTDSAHGGHITFQTTLSGQVGSLERMRIDNAGNVGIGTTSPGSQLTVIGSVAIGLTSAAMKFQVSDGANHSIMFGPGATNVIQSMNDIGSAWVPLTISTVSGIFLNPNGGNVGIGTTSPATPLTVAAAGSSLSGLAQLSVVDSATAAASNPYAAVTGAGNNGVRVFMVGNPGGASWGQDTILWSDYGALRLGANGTERVRVTTAGNVGIGTTSPASALDVSGTISSNGVPVSVTAQSKPARAIGTVYQNTAGKAIRVVVSTQPAASSSVAAYSDSSTNPSTFICQQGSPGGGEIFTMTFLVLNGYYYKVINYAGSNTLIGWVEYT